MNQDKSETVFTVRNLSKHFAELKAVDGISFDVFKGEIFGFLGPNGAGKTTTINMICGLLPASGGQIEYSHSADRDQKIKTRIGICPQENIFWPKLTCREQLLFSGRMYGRSEKEIKQRAPDLLETMGLQDKANVLAKNLSGGMKRRLNICLALMHDPDILVFDEPEAGLDPQSRILVREFIKGLAKQKTIILTTHNMDEADRLSDRVAIIDQGKLLLVDTPRNLKKSIGEGDLLEISLGQADLKKLQPAIDQFTQQFTRVTYHDSLLLINSKNLIESVADISSALTAAGVVIQSMTMRENTLEDVFIHLTGRKLRQ